MDDYFISINIQSELCDRVNEFSEKYLSRFDCRYLADARGKFIFLYRQRFDGTLERIGRLTYKGDKENMDFAFFNRKKQKNDPDCLPSKKRHLDGTIEGAMKAGLEAYPPKRDYIFKEDTNEEISPGNKLKTDKDINKESHQIWEDLGPWWDASVEDGDYFHRVFLYPTIEKFLDLKGEEHVLDAGCGNGALSRYIEKKGATVFGIDFSSTLITSAKQRSQGIKFEQMDLTNKDELRKLAKTQTFDRIVCSMVLHDMSTIGLFFESLQYLLKPKGSFYIFNPSSLF